MALAVQTQITAYGRILPNITIIIIIIIIITIFIIIITIIENNRTTA
jgi:hypothetical protein